MTMFFDKLSGYNNKMFCYEFISSRTNYNKGEITMQEVFEALKTVNRTDQAAGIWSKLMPNKHKTTMLTTTHNKTKKEHNKLKSSGGGGGRGNGGDKGGRGGSSNGGGGGRGSGGGQEPLESFAWMLAKITDTIKHPTQVMAWSGASCVDPVAPRGLTKACISMLPMTMHNGFSPKNEKHVQFEAKKKAPKPSKTKADDQIKSTNKSNNEKKSLKLSNAVVTGLTTEIMLGNSDARVLNKN